MRVKLTDQAINKATRDSEADGKRRELADPDCRGLRIRITPAGARSWILGARDKLGHARRFPLGSYPKLGISGARGAARDMHHKVKHEGADPIAEKRRNVALGRQAMEGTGTLKALLDTYEKHGNPPKSWDPGRPRVELVFKKLLNRPCPMLTVGDLQLEADAYSFPKSAAFAVRTLRPVLKWAAAPGRAYVPRDVVQLAPPAKIEARKRTLSRQELKAVLPQLRASERPQAKLMHFLLLTLARREEAVSAKWSNVDFVAGTWTIPKTKNGQDHVVPLSRQAKSLLTALGAGKNEDFVFHTSGGASLGNWDRETKRIVLASGLGKKVDEEEKKVQKAAGKVVKTGDIVMKDRSATWTRHDLRRTGATLLGNMGVIPDIIEAALNHVAVHSPLASNYNMSRYRPQVAEALQLLADELDMIAEGTAAPDATEGTGAGIVPSGSGADGRAGQAGEVGSQAGEVHQG